MAIIDSGSNAAGKANVDSTYNLQVNPPGYDSAGVIRGGGDVNAGASAIFSEIDAGTKTGTRETLSPEVDKDYRLRVAHDVMMDNEQFNYASQNTGKHTYVATTLLATMTTAGITTNSGSITTTNTGMNFGTHAMFPVGGTQTLVCETSVAFSAQPNANTVIDFGLFQRGATTLYAPLDGVYFRMNSAGMFGVINIGGVETTTSVFPLTTGTGTFVYTNNAVNRYLIQVNNVSTSFWINNYKYGEIANPVGANFPCLSQGLPWSIRHAIGVAGAAGAITQANVKDYRVFIRGAIAADPLGTIGNRVLGSYQGLSGGTMGQLVAGTVTTGTLVKPTAAVPVNISLTANLPNSLGGRIWEQLTAGLAVNTDGILAMYTVPAGSTVVQGRRLKVTGINLSACVSTVLVGGPVNCEFYIVYGATADSLQTAESGSMVTPTTKAPRRMMLPRFTQAITAAQAVQTMISQPGGFSTNFIEPIYVNPGERIGLVVNRFGTALTAGVISYTYQFEYSWE